MLSLAGLLWVDDSGFVGFSTLAVLAADAPSMSPWRAASAMLDSGKVVVEMVAG